ncbi:hypothetical protein WJX75_008758 [Coccomyxa subellipsoidea]|uniref:FH2 domain-containing protein n=1 Tax=Coccomyxa subellipsoidea TaxID=248742 RepID=A0ABR2YNI2_9CHLO
MQALCSVLCGLHNAQPEMRRLHQLNSRHLRPLVQRLQATEDTLQFMQISEKDLTSLQKLQGILWPFIEDFKKTAHALRNKAMQERKPYCTATNAVAPAA